MASGNFCIKILCSLFAVHDCNSHMHLASELTRDALGIIFPNFKKLITHSFHMNLEQGREENEMVLRFLQQSAFSVSFYEPSLTPVCP